jgi:hypothetical protein
MPKILVLHGPNLNLLGQRETQHYGNDTLQSIDQRLVERGKREGVEVVTFQSNAEGPSSTGFMRRKATKRLTSSSILPASRTRASPFGTPCGGGDPFHRSPLVERARAGSLSASTRTSPISPGE